MNDLSFQDIDSRVTVLFESDELAPHEHQLIFRRGTPLEPEKRLMLAVLEDAISCFQRYLYPKNAKEAKLHAEVVVWIFEQSESRVFSFENICDTCGLDPGYVRMGLSRWREQMNTLKSSRGRTLSKVRMIPDAVAHGSSKSMLGTNGVRFEQKLDMDAPHNRQGR